MKFTLSWLADHLETTASLDELTTKLSAIGLEVEGVEDPAKALAAFTIARVVEAKQHPNADRLRVAQVEIAPGKPPVEVVCGAPNCRTGMIGVFAPIGTYIPGTGITLEKKPVRGIASNGMLCSEREMQLSDDHVGIVDLGDQHAGDIGKRYIDVMDLADPVIEIKLTPNRPDCTGVRGVARDLAAAGLGKLKPEPLFGQGRGQLRLPGRHRARIRTGNGGRLPGVRWPLREGRQERPLAGLAAEAAESGRPQADQRPRRHHQLHLARSWPAAARLRRR